MKIRTRFLARAAAPAVLAVLLPAAAGPLVLAQNVRLDLGDDAPLFEAPPDHPPAAPCDPCCGGPVGIPNVYLHTGEFHLSVVDLAIPGRGLNFVWARRYRSRLGPDTAQGNGWDFSYNIAVRREGKAVRVHDGNGRSDLYRERPDGSYVAEQLFQEGRFGGAASRVFTLTFADGGAWVFHPLDGGARQGKIASIADRNGNTLRFDYDAAGRLSVVTDTLGRIVRVFYRPDGRIGSIADFAGRAVAYDYYVAGERGGEAGDLKSARSPRVAGTPNGNDFPDGKTTTYTYSEGFSDDRLNHNLLTITDPKGQTWLRNVYASETSPSALLFDRLVRQVRGHPDDVIDVTYHARPPRSGLPGGLAGTSPFRTPLTAIVNDRAGNVKEFDYGARGRCVALRELTGRADPNMPTTMTENRPSNSVRSSDPTAFETRFAYNADSRVVRIVHPNGNVTRKAYELDLDPAAPWRARGNLREVHRTPGSHVPPGDQASLDEFYEYVSDRGGCCGMSFVLRARDARGNVTEHDYDARGNRIQTRHRIPAIVEDFAYDQFGRQVRHVHPDNGSGWRQTDTWTWYGPSDGAQNGYLATETIDASGTAITTSFEYDAVGNAIRITDARGNATTMVVNALDQVVRSTSPPVRLMNGTFVRYETETWFDANDNVVRVETANLDDTGLVDPANPRLTTMFEHEILNRVVRTTREIDAARSVVTEFEYDANRNRTLTRSGEAVRGTQPFNVTRHVFDERDLLFRSIRAPGDPLQSTDQFDYDGNGHLVRRLTGLEDMPRTTKVVVDAYGRDVETTDPMGNVTSKNFDPNGNVVRTIVRGEICDGPGGAQNVRLCEQECSYDAENRPVQCVEQHFDPASQSPVGDGLATCQVDWTDRSETARIVDDNGSATTFSYDTANRLRLAVDAAGNSREMIYDRNHNLLTLVETERSDRGGPDQVVRTERTYDEIDRAVSETDPIGNRLRFGYDSRDDLTTIVDAMGNVTRMTYDGLQRLRSSTRILTDDGTGAGRVIGQIGRSWDWDDNSRLVQLTDDNGNRTDTVYDALDRRTSVRYADGSVESLVHDVHGNVVLSVDPNGTSVATEFDLLGRPGGRAIAPGPGVSSDTTFENFKFDGLSRLVRAEDDDSVVTREWDSLSNLATESQNGKTFLFTYDGVGNLLRLAYPGGKTVTRTYDALNRVKTIASPGPVASYEYVGPRRVERRVSGAGVATSLYLYDGARRVVAIDHFAGAAEIDRRTFEWDAMHNKQRARDVRAGGLRLVHDYFYDSQYRLVRALVGDARGGTVRDMSYVLDGAGNRLAVAGGEPCDAVYSMDPTMPEPADFQVNQYTTAPCVGDIAHDENGNVILRSGTDRLVRDHRNQLVEHETPARRTLYAYDALGRRIAMTVPGGPPAGDRRYFYVGRNVAEERDGMDVVTTTYAHGRPGPGSDNPLFWVMFNPQPDPPCFAPSEIVEMANQRETYYLYCDDLGSTRAVTDSSGAVVERYEYEDFGFPTIFDSSGAEIPTSLAGNDFLFTGQRFDTESSFYFYKARYLDPTTGRFLSRDPLGMWGDAVNLGNGFAYAGNNPQTLVDPTGMASVKTNCGGPWPGPRAVYSNRIDCGLMPSSGIGNALCKAMRGAGRAHRAASQWLSLSINGSPGGWSWLVGVPFSEWFAGPDGKIAPAQKVGIFLSLVMIWEPFRTGQKIGIECEGAGDTCSGSNAYVPWYDSNIHLCPAWWQNLGANRRSAVILHEMGHQYAGLADIFYYSTATTTSPANPKEPFASLFETSGLMINADTYEEMLLKYFIQ